jgi:hypothetical protein
MLSWRRTIPDRPPSIDSVLKITEPIVFAPSAADVHPCTHWVVKDDFGNWRDGQHRAIARPTTR